MQCREDYTWLPQPMPQPQLPPLPHPGTCWMTKGYNPLAPRANRFKAKSTEIKVWIRELMSLSDDMPVGIVTGLAGGVFFGWLLRRATRIG